MIRLSKKSHKLVTWRLIQLFIVTVILAIGAVALRVAALWIAAEVTLFGCLCCAALIILDSIGRGAGGRCRLGETRHQIQHPIGRH